NLIVAGFVDGTRMFTAYAPNTLNTDHRRVYFFGMPGTSSPRPMCNTEVGAYLPWFEHVQNPTDASDGNFTNLQAWKSAAGVAGALLREAQMTTLPYPKIPRNLVCDFSPHLIADFHPLWGNPLMGTIVSSHLPDGYAANPWDDSNPPQPIQVSVRDLADNSCRYHKKDGAPHGTWRADP